MDIGKNLKASIDILKENFMPLVLAGVIAWLLSSVTLGILTGPLMGGFIVLCLKFVRGGKGDFNEVLNFSKFVPTFVVALLAGIAYSILAIIPFLNMLLIPLAGPAFSFIVGAALIMVIEKDAAPIDALKNALELFTSNNPAMLWVYCFVMGIISAVGIFACGIGIFATMPLGAIGIAFAYEELTSKQIVDTATSVGTDI